MSYTPEAKDMRQCPLIKAKPDLCKEALSSLMIDDKDCFSEAYTRCPIFLINKPRWITDDSEPTLHDRASSE